MPKKKNQKNVKPSEQNEVEAAEENVLEIESVSSETETDLHEVVSDVENEHQPDELDDASGEDVHLDEVELSADDLLDDVRRSLIEENEKAEEIKKPSLWQKIGFGGQKKKSAEDVDAFRVDDSIELENVDIVNDEVDVQDDAIESIDDLIEMLETDDEDVSSETVVVEVEEQSEEPKVEEKKVNVEELKKRAFERSKPDDREESFSDVRAVALEGGEEVFIEVEVKDEDPVEDRLKSFENALRPYKRYIYFGIAFVGLIVIIATSSLLYDAYRQSLPPEPTKDAVILPYPVVLNIPGGLSFNLGRGVLDDGGWNPRNPEWLEGTEICRWVAIPYSRQLEAVIRTLTRDDQLEIVMSNNDRWSYDVYSITQMSIEDMQKTSSSTPCLLLVLADINSETRWVVTAYP